jgi:hypothetical protein
MLPLKFLLYIDNFIYRLRYLLINLLITQVQSRKLVTIIYLDNILVSLKIEEEYKDYIKEVLDRLKE